ncbi:MAG TPA: transporter [Terriglobales bacterium]|nr:transporter [Terriglobales bacterium]
MNKWLLLFCFAVAVLHLPGEAWAQFTDAHSYDNTPVGTNQIELSYTYVHANSSIDTSLIIAGAKLNLNQGMISYARYFGLFNRTMWAEAGVPIAGLSGSVSGTRIQGSINGAGDSSYQIAMLLKGGPALTVEQFEGYKPTTTLGVSFTLTAPSGQYNASKILDLGSDRWLFKPEIALSQPFGPEQKWQVDTYANAYFYTDNTSYRGREILHQQPLPGFEGHLSYSFNDSVWVSVDTRYSFGAITFLNGVDQNNGQQNFILGSEMNVSINTRNSLLFEFAKAPVHQNGPALTGFTVKYDYTWGKGYQ